MCIIGPIIEGCINTAGSVDNGFCDVILDGGQQVEGSGSHLYPLHRKLESEGSAIGDDVKALHRVGNTCCSLIITAQDILNLLVLTA